MPLFNSIMSSLPSFDWKVFFERRSASLLYSLMICLKSIWEKLARRFLTLDFQCSNERTCKLFLFETHSIIDLESPKTRREVMWHNLATQSKIQRANNSPQVFPPLPQFQLICKVWTLFTWIKAPSPHLWPSSCVTPTKDLTWGTNSRFKEPFNLVLFGVIVWCQSYIFYSILEMTL